MSLRSRVHSLQAGITQHCSLRKPKNLVESVTLSSEQQRALTASDTNLLTIVTINRNNAMNLPRTLESLDQVRGDDRVQCLFIDGASDDDSIELAKGFYEPGRWFTEPDRGIYHAMNKGLYRARGRYVLWLNSGDTLERGVKDLVLDRLSKSKADLVSFSVYVVDEGCPEKHRTCFSDDGALPNNMVPHQGACFSRKCITKMGGYREDFAIVADRDLILRMFFLGKDIVHSREIISRFYAGGLSSGRRYYLETIRLNYLYGAYSLLGYLLRVMKFHLILNR